MYICITVYSLDLICALANATVIVSLGEKLKCILFFTDEHRKRNEHHLNYVVTVTFFSVNTVLNKQMSS